YAHDDRAPVWKIHAWGDDPQPLRWYFAAVQAPLFCLQQMVRNDPNGLYGYAVVYFESVRLVRDTCRKRGNVLVGHMFSLLRSASDNSTCLWGTALRI